MQGGDKPGQWSAGLQRCPAGREWREWATGHALVVADIPRRAVGPSYPAVARKMGARAAECTADHSQQSSHCDDEVGRSLVGPFRWVQTFQRSNIAAQTGFLLSPSPPTLDRCVEPIGVSASHRSIGVRHA